MILQVLWVAVVTGFLFATHNAVAEALRRARPPLGSIPGPKSLHWFLGNPAEKNHEVTGEWNARWGPTISFYSVFRDKSPCTVDPKAVNHILSRHNIYQKPKAQNERLTVALGKGLIFAKGNAHKYQRKIPTPAFEPPQMKALTEVFNEKAVKVERRWHVRWETKSI